MLKSLVISAFRNIFRSKAFSIINLIGLSVSMSLGMLIILIVKEQLTYDNFHNDVGRIYRVNTMALRVDGQQEPYASAPLPVGRAIKEEYTFSEDVVTINAMLNGDVTFENVNVPLSGLIVSPSFFTVFNFPLQKGNTATALDEPNNLVLTKAMAERIFGTTEALGQTVSISGYGEFTVTGVLQEFPSKTHLEFEALASMSALPAWEKAGNVLPTSDNWNNYYGNYIYFKLKEGKTEKEVITALQAINKKYYTGLKLETRDKKYEFYLHPLTEITPGPELSNQMGSGMPTFLLIFLGSLAGIVLLMSVFNYTNLMIAKSLSRSREIGIRKVVGAKRAQVFLQFVGESVVFSLLALFVSYILLQFLKSGYLQLPLNEEFAMDLKEDVMLYVVFAFFAIAVGILAGLLPAGYLSAFKPLQVLKDSANVKIYSRLTFRKILMVTQFAFSVIFVIVVLVVYSQVNFMLNADYGFNQRNILNVRLQGMDYHKLATSVSTISGVERVGGVSHRLGTWSDRSSDYKRNKEDEPFTMRDFIVNSNYIENLELPFLAGQNFGLEDSEGNERFVILNETALPRFGFESPATALGQSIFVDDSVMLVVKGVLKDFHFRPLNSQIGPLALRCRNSELNYASMKINPEQRQAIIETLKVSWKKLDPIHGIDYMMFDEEIDDAYRQAGMKDILVIIGYITFLAVTLACLGMLGMAMYATQTRIKEVGIRKVMGASVLEITVLLSKSFMILIATAAVVGLPISIFLSNFFLDIYAYKIEISFLLVSTGLLLITVLGLLTIGSQTINAARLNPVKSLRYE
jgi:putative ABC transport system permease protein